jgi:hypothetical protein
MISKVLPAGGSFYHTCRYVCQDQGRARILDSEGIREHDYRLMTEDFEGQHQLHPEVEKAVFHSVLSFPPGENPDDPLMVELARKYLVRLELSDTQFVITRHTDKDHAHLHIIANRIGNNGAPIDDSWLGLRGKKVAEELTREYKLAPALKKDLQLTHRENLNESEERRYRLYDAIAKILPGCQNLEDLEKKLLKQGIDVQYRKKEGTGERQGISFRLENECFKGSQVDRDFSLKRIQQTLALQQAQRQKQEQRQYQEVEREWYPRQSHGMRRGR